MSDMTEMYDVPTKDQMMSFVAKVSAGDDDILEFEFHQYSEAINEILLEIREGMKVTDELKEELSGLYDDWKAEGFPIPDEDYEALQEGGSEKSDPELVDPDKFPDPEDL